MGYSKREVAFVVVITAAMVAGAAEGITCDTVDNYLTPCVAYAIGQTSAPSAQCCSGVTGLYNAIKNSRPDRMTACNCIKSLVASVGSAIKPANVQALPGKCGLNLGYTIGTNTNCATIP